MLKYFKRQKCRLNSTNEENDHNYNNIAAAGDVTDQVESGIDDGGAGATTDKRHSLRSTSSFCDEVFLEELASMSLSSAAGVGVGSGSSGEDDAVSCGALSLGALSNHCYNGIMNSTTVGLDEDHFKYHSRLSMTLTSVVNEPNCLSYFVQYLEKKNALPLIKFYLDTENFKNAALAQLRKELKSRLTAQQIPEEGDYEATTTATFNDTDDQIQQSKQQQQHLQQIEMQASGTERHINGNGGGGAVAGVGVATNIEADNEEDDNSHVPELKTLCDLTMRKPLTDDEKSQIYAETNKHIFKTSERHKLKASSELSLCSLISNFSEITENAVISMASVKDALAIYKKYLIQDAKQRIELPVDILSKISLIICKKDVEEGPEEGATSITADCFLEAQQHILYKLEKGYLNDFLQSTYYVKYCVDLIEGHHLNMNDILHSEVTLFYFMEYLEQHQERDCLDFWSTAINYRKSYVANESSEKDEKEAQSDAMIIYDKFFSLQNETKLWSSNKLRAHVEASICTDGMVYHCFDLPLKVAAKYLERKYLKSFLKSSLFSNYMNELKSKIQEDFDTTKEGLTKFPAKLALRRCVSDKTSNRHRKTLSDCTLDKKLTISQHNTLLASMDSHYHGTTTTPNTSTPAHLKQFQLNIDSSQLTNPDLLWHRSNSNNLKFGRVNSLGRYERDFVSPSDALHTSTSLKSSSNWSLSFKGNKLKNAMRKLVNLPEDNVQEEIAWQVAEMIVKDVTSVTMGTKTKNDNSNKDKAQKV